MLAKLEQDAGQQPRSNEAEEQQAGWPSPHQVLVGETPLSSLSKEEQQGRTQKWQRGQRGACRHAGSPA
jgi:hypothetical protein